MTNMKNESSGLSILWFLLFCWGAWALLSDAWHSKARYSMQYNVDSDHVFVNDEPTDCNFMRRRWDQGLSLHRIVQTRFIRTRTASTMPLPTAPCDPTETIFTSGGSAWMRNPDNLLSRANGSSRKSLSTGGERLCACADRCC